LEPSFVVLLLRILIVAGLFLFLGYVLIMLRRDLEPRSEMLELPAAHFFLAEGADTGQVFLLQETNLIGRAPSSTIQIHEPTISAVHARVTYSSKQWMLEDLGSRNGTFVNDMRVEEPLPIIYGDKIRFGSVLVILTSRLDPPTQPEIQQSHI